MNRKRLLVISIIFFILLVDQWLKIWVKTHMEYGEEIRLFDLPWALIHFVENNGMAFGLALGGDYGKLALSLFRIFAVVFLSVYIDRLVRMDTPSGLLVCFGMVLAGALGNIIDSALYGLVFTESPFHGGLASLVPMGQGYAGFLHGKVVDMFYFPILQGTFPAWLPVWGGEPYLFFRPVFNVADSSITLGVLSIILFYRRFFSADEKPHIVQPVATQDTGVLSLPEQPEAALEPSPSDETPAPATAEPDDATGGYTTPKQEEPQQSAT